jgi:hypothetical protein
MTVRAFYLDLAQWAVTGPEKWAVWACPPPVSAAETAGQFKQKHRRKARMDQRTRTLAPWRRVVGAGLPAAGRYLDLADEIIGAAVQGVHQGASTWRFSRSGFSAARRGHEVIIVGHSLCPGPPELEGPALWKTVVANHLVTTWHVFEDTAETLRRLGIDGGQLQSAKLSLPPAPAARARP